MMCKVSRLLLGLVALAWIGPVATADNDLTAALDPRGKIHIPIGIANTLDSLKTFVEAEGSVSPGVGTYGIYFWLYDQDTSRLFTPTMEGVRCVRGLAEEGHLIPRWNGAPGLSKSKARSATSCAAPGRGRSTSSGRR